MSNQFDYNEAFSRNLGWVTELEQQQLRGKKIAIGGMGGVGGNSLLTCARLGVSNFHIADFDNFELVNFNRQVGATVATVSKPKIEVLIAMAQGINPEVKVQSFTNGITEDNVDAFLDGVDICLDSIDLFCMETRQLIYAECYKRNIPCISALPLGMGFTQMVFMPGKMKAEDYFDLSGNDEIQNAIKMAVGMSPKHLHTQYLMDRSRVHFLDKKGPSTFMGCQLCSGSVVTEVLKILLGRGKIYAAPYSLQYDAYVNKFARTYMPWGNKNPMQKLRLAVMKKIAIDKDIHEFPYPKLTDDPIKNIFELARWAPSTDDGQEWRFVKLSDTDYKLTMLPRGLPVSSEQKYKLTFIHAGIMLETLRIAASYFKYDFSWSLESPQSDNEEYHFQLNFTANPSLTPDPLADFIKARCTNRKVYSKREIDPEVKAAIKQQLSDNYDVVYRRKSKKWKTTMLEYWSLQVEMLHPIFDIVFSDFFTKEAFPEKGMPIDSFNLSFLSKYLNKKLQGKTKLFNTITRTFKGYISSLFEASLIPNMVSGEHFVLKRVKKSEREENLKHLDFIEDGQMLIRYWLLCTQHGLSIYPSYFQIILSRPSEQEFLSSSCPKLTGLLKKIKDNFEATYHAEADDVVFTGRVGFPKSAKIDSRSLRLPLDQLLIDKTQK